MATTTRRRRAGTPAHTLRAAAPFFAVLAARHGIIAALAPARTPHTATRRAQDTRPTTQDHLPGLEARQCTTYAQERTRTPPAATWPPRPSTPRPSMPPSRPTEPLAAVLRRHAVALRPAADAARAALLARLDAETPATR